jgi:hypothetical protein
VARSKKVLIDSDPDFNDDGSLKPRTYETYILKPMEGMGLAFDDGSLITFTTKVVNGVTENYTNGYHANIIGALEEIYKHVLKIRVVKKTKLKHEELELSEIRDVIVKTNKEFEKLWVNIQKR